MTMLIVIIVLALLFDYINGFHDAANSIATVVSTKVLTPFQAVLWAAIFNFAAYWIFEDHAVANTISKTVNKEFITLQVILAGLIAAIFWNLLTWWYGIPSSSSHTLIGGFAGAAIAHAIQDKGISISWDKIVESQTIIKTVLFIFLAPLIGMAISIFITIITIMRNIWLRILLIALTTACTAFLFDRFEESKMDEGLQKFIKLDKYQSDFAKAENALQLAPNDEKAKQELNSAEKKLSKAKEVYNQIAPQIKDYDNIGADVIAASAYSNGLLADIEVSKLKDEVRNANSYLVLEALSTDNKEKHDEFEIAKKETEKYKEPLKAFLKKEISLDSTMTAINVIYPIDPKNLDKIKPKLKNLISNNHSKRILKNLTMAELFGASFLHPCYLYWYTSMSKK